jgi:hypothetical protein
MSARARLPRAVWPLALLALVGCSLLDPNVGSNQAACGVQAGSTASGYGSAGTDAAAMCGADAGSACDDCESRWCCPTRVACYADPVCDCADQAMNLCPGVPQGDAEAGDAASAAVGRCWEAFATSGDIAKSRLACLRAWCQEVCGVP